MHYLVVGSGLFGSVFAHEMANLNHTVTVLEKKDHIGGNIFTKQAENIHVHKYGAHIFHTSNKKIWDYINKFAEFNHFINSPISISNGKVYNLPFNMNTFNQLWGVVTPKQAKSKIKAQQLKLVAEAKNLEEKALALVGRDIYEALIKQYTKKQWGKDCKELPAFIISRLPIRYTYDNNYFNDAYQGIPKGGYTQIIEKMLKHKNIKLHLNTDFLHDKATWLKNDYYKIIYTGTIDEYYNYCFGALEYRSLKFEHQLLKTDNYQGNAVVNYNDLDIAYTRIIEHKHFDFQNQKNTIITKEYPEPWRKGSEPYYPINDEKNNSLYQKYYALAKKDKRLIFGGRLGMYKYFDMHKVIEAALELSAKENTSNTHN